MWAAPDAAPLAALRDAYLEAEGDLEEEGQPGPAQPGEVRR